MLVRLIVPHRFGETELPAGTLVATSEKEGDELILGGVAEPATQALTGWL